MSVDKINQIALSTLLISPLLSYFLVDIFDLPSTTFYFRLFVGFYGVIFLIMIAASRQRVNFPKFCWPLIPYAIYMILWSVINGEIQRRGLVKVIGNHIDIQTIMLFVLIYNTRFSKGFMKFSIAIIYITVMAAFIASIYQVYNPNFMLASFSRTGWEVGSIYAVRRTSIFGFTDANEYGMTFLPLLTILVSWLVHGSNKSYMLVVILGGVVAVLTNTRYIIVGFIIVLHMMINHYRHEMFKSLKSALIGILIVLIIMMAISYVGYDYTDFYQERLFAEGSLEESSRYLAFETFVKYFNNQKWFGTGISTFQDDNVYRINAGRSSQIHIGYLDHLVSRGIFGSIFYFSFLILLVIKLRRTAIRTGYWGSFYAFVIFLWANATLVNFSMFFYGLVFAFIYDRYFSSDYSRVSERPFPLREDNPAA